jgi:succinate dehydrogenase/fumarate reductase cytochrome b subunit
MKFKYSLFASLLLIPTVTKAQTLQAYIPALIEFLGSTFISFLLGIAFLIFVINVVRFFIIESNNEEGRSKAKAVMTWSIIAFTLIIVFWGLINIIGTSLGFGEDTQPISDYIER